MKFSVAAALVAATGAVAHSNVTVTTEVVDVYTTYCPAATQITHGSKTYTVTAPTTLTITDCPCTITKPVTVTSSVVCHDCPGSGSNGTVTVPVPSSTGTQPTAVPTAGAGKAAALSGAGLAGIVGFAALVL